MEAGEMKRSVRESNVVALRLRELGDVLATLGALQALKEAGPDREVSYVVDDRFHPLLKNEPYIDRLLASPPKVRSLRELAGFVRYVRNLRNLHADIVLDFHSNTRSAFITSLLGAKVRAGYDVKVRKVAYNVVEPRADLAGGRTRFWNSAQSSLRLARHAGATEDQTAMLPELAVDDTAVRGGVELLASAGVPGEAAAAGTVAGLNPGKIYQSKAWPEDHFVRLAQALADRGQPVVLLWGPGERDSAAGIADRAGDGVWLGPAVDLEALPGVLKNLAYVVTIDSGLKHLAVCVRVPTVTIFGSTSPREWHIGTHRDGYLWKGYSCSPCRRLDCPMGAPCMSDVSPEDVLAEIGRLGLIEIGGNR
jgi:ADP-heptose:LPS heptosyltransferase